MKLIRALGLLLALAPAYLCGGSPAWAQMYRWTDDQGAAHYSQGLDSVPERYRSRAQLLVYPATPAATPAASSGLPEVSKATRIPFTPGKPIMVTARVNGSGSVQLMLDTGASVTVINPRTLVGLGIGSRDSLRGSVKGATGSANVLFVPVQSIEVGTVRSGPLRVAAHDIEFGLGDGLLGRDFLDQFTVTIDSTAGVVTLSPR
jgi:hypothetical protein